MTDCLLKLLGQGGNIRSLPSCAVCRLSKW